MVPRKAKGSGVVLWTATGPGAVLQKIQRPGAVPQKEKGPDVALQDCEKQAESQLLHCPLYCKCCGIFFGHLSRMRSCLIF